jgi:uncharacterized protein
VEIKKNTIFAVQFLKRVNRMSVELFDIEIGKYKEGVHRIEFEMDSEFFKSYESSCVEDGKVWAELIFDKGAFAIKFDFKIKGEVKRSCDRCLNDLSYPVESTFNLVAKITADIGEDEEHLTYILPNEQWFKTASYFMEMVCLSLPIKVVCEDVNQVCDSSMLEKFMEEEEEEIPSQFEKLKNLFKDNKI